MAHSLRPRRLAIGAGLTAAWLLASTSFEAAKIEVKTQRDESFSFKGLRTWGWDPEGAGSVKVAYSSHTDPAPIDRNMRPTIIAAVEREFAKRGFTKSDDQPELTVHYYLLVTATTWTQTMGQFAPAVTEWGLPPFTPQTTALEVLPIGTFLLDLWSPSRNGLVFRGAAQAKINLDRSTEQRKKALDQAIVEIFKKLPPTK